ncbi:hypothetical protein [Microbacterium phage MO526]|uniref:Uncharacterized protein n=1 Tax=Microbacterium phage MO526 TaxID=3108092 RepID=A0ABZ0ZXW6_9CAUD|nr:hypothetical protein [Microbacterium phage MO526]
MSEYIRLVEAPAIVLRYPECGACGVDLGHDGDDWVCPVCGTSWPTDAGDGDTGSLYEEWSGESLDDAPALDSDAAFNAGIVHTREARKRLYASLGWCEHGQPAGGHLTGGCPGGAANSD